MLISRAILSSTAMAIIAKPLLANGACVTPLINEFKPNPTGADPPNTRVEILCADSDKGAGSDFSGWLVSIESDPGSSNPGDINDFAQISGAFDANGLFVATIPDLENPSFTLVLMDSFTGDSSTDIDLDNDGTPDDLSTFGLVFDAIGILDTIGDPVYGVELGGTDIAYTGDEPRLVFRDGTDPSMLFAINDPDNDQVIAADGSVLEPSIFDTNPLLDTFGSINPSLSSIEGPAPAPVPAVFIHDIQGSGYESPLNGEIVTVEAVVVGDFQENDADESRNLRGFFLQEEDADADDDLSTSEGIFVFDGSNPTVDVSIGDLVRVTGTVDEYFGETQITDVTEVTILTPSFGLPSPTTISLPTTATTVGQDGDIQPDLEAFEGMLVTFSDTLSINEMFQLDRFNEIKLVQGERPFHFTQQNLPDTVGYQHHLEEVGARQITYDDGLALQNQLICNLDGFGEGPCQSGSFSTASNIRMGDTVTGLTGILYYKWAGNGASGATWRVSSVANNSVWFNKVNERPTRLPNLGGQYKLASLNVLNYFATIDTNGARTANEQEPRGADNAEEFSRQTEKLTRAILDMDVDVLGLVELENDFARGSNGNAIEFLVETLNAKTGDETFAWVDPGTQFVDSGDAISNGFIYKVSSIKRIEGDVAILRDETAAGLGIDVPSEGIFDGRSTSRAPIAVSFRFSTGPCITVALNHLKSKGSINGAPGNEDSGDGAGNNNANRLLAAQAIHTWLETEPTGNKCQRKAIIGDLNSYAKEDPITYLESVGYTDTARASNGDSIYSYVFDGQIGTLDYILVNRWLLNKVTGAATWNINADEPDAIDYNLDFGRDPAIFASDTPYRFSDHDALVVGMDL